MFDKRFQKIYSEGNAFSGYTEILVDRDTGVNYLFHGSGYAGGMSVLLDANGKPVVSPVNYEK